MTNQDFTVTPDLYASKGNRFANYIIDLIIIMVLIYGTVILLAMIWYAVAEDPTVVDDFFYEIEHANPLLDRLISALLLALFYFAFEALLKGRTIGKYITKTKVVRADGSNPSAIDYLKRSFSRIIPFEAFSFLGAEARGWHDTLSKTYVVDVAKFEARKKTHGELDQIGVSIDS